MRTILKYHIKPEQIRESFILELPRSAQVRSFQLQRELLTLWVEVDTDAPLEPRRFGIFGTGNHIAEETMRYIGTVQFTYGLVWHLFEYIIANGQTLD